MAGLDVCRDGGLVRIQGMVVVQEGSGGDGGIGEVPLLQTQLRQSAEHAVGDHAPQLALLDLHAAGQGGLVPGHGDQVAHMDVPGTGDDLNGLGPARVDLADPHVVAVFVAGHGQHLANHHVGDLCAQVLGGLHLGAGQGHGLCKIMIGGVDGDKLAEPFTR